MTTTPQQTHTETTATKIPGYPDNLASVTTCPDAPSLIPRITAFSLLVLFICIGWNHVHNVIDAKQDKLSGVYTVAFLPQAENGTNTVQDDAAHVLERIQNLHTIQTAAHIDNANIPAFHNTPAEKLPALLHVQIRADYADKFQKQIGTILNDFPHAVLRAHEQDPRLQRIVAQHTRFLHVLDLSTIAAIGIALTSLLMALQRWLSPYTRTIALLRILGAEDKTILYVFGRQIERHVLKGAVYAAGLVLLACVLPLSLLGVFSQSLPARAFNPLIILPLVFIVTGIIYMVAKLRIQTVLKQQLVNIA